ncbi:MAG: hypothetical protein J6S67_24270 [Methanobrevibacter sp.]|nr:hypothetical protein [Methanobrevibacter sp.]
MFICDGKVVGFRSYEKNGQKKTYVQVVYKSKIDGYVGERACACLAVKSYKIGDPVKVADDFMRPEIIEE